MVDVIGNRVLVDFNHPFAGKTLHYSFKIEEKVDTPAEQFQGLIKLYAGREMDLSIDEGKATIDLPPGNQLRPPLGIMEEQDHPRGVRVH